MDWQRFLTLARCPAPLESDQLCLGTLEQSDAGLTCTTCSQTYSVDAELDIPSFAPRSEEEIKEDKYEDPKQRYAEKYLGLWAFGYHFLQRGETEGFYRALNDLAFETPLSDQEHLNILEVGCGVGRTACDYARHYRNGFVVGIDYSPRMLAAAYHIIIGSPPGGLVKVPLEAEGFGAKSAASFGLENVFLAQASALQLPFATEGFNLVVSPNVIDRVPDPEQMLHEITRVLKPGGYFVFADPLNWVNLPERWESTKNLAALRELFEQCGLRVELAFDGLVYREPLDARDGITEWKEAMLRARK